MFRVRLTCVIALAALTACLTATVASAAGSSSIASAPFVTSGAHLFGDTSRYAAGADNCFCTYQFEYWKSHLLAGDVVTVKFANASNSMSVGVTGLAIYPAGTDDFTVARTGSATEIAVTSNGHAQLRYTAPKTGDYPFGFYSKSTFSDAGAYDFTTTVVHRARLDVATTAPLGVTGTLDVVANYPDGTPIASGLGATLSGYWTHRWHKLGKASVAAGQIHIPYKLPASRRGTVIKLAVNAGGASFMGVRIVKQARIG